MTLARILRRLPVVAFALAVAACAPCPIPQTQPAPTSPGLNPPAPLEPSRAERADAQAIVEEAESPRVVEVQIRTMQEGASGEFAPREVRVRQGDVVRFRMADGYSVHNVVVIDDAHGTRGIPFPPPGPYLAQQGQSWQIRIDLPPGRYGFACLPHAEFGHRGTLIVEP
jgi:plastocyanin